MSGENTVGSIVGFLRLDADQFHREMERAIAEADHLDGKNVDVKVKADTARAEAGLAAVSAQADKVDRSNKKMDQSSRQAGQGMGALVTAIVAVGPAVVPLAAATVGLAAGFGAMGAAGIAAIVGIRHEMQVGSSTGLAYTSGIKTLTTDMNTLGSVAARGVLAPFQATVRDLQTRMPNLTTNMGQFGAVTGRTAGLLVSGLLSAFVSLEPLMRDVAVYTYGLAQRFQALMAGPGVVAFGSYVQSVFPQVMSAVEQLVGAAIHLVAAFAPLGMGTISVIGALSQVISAIPVDVLSTLATVASAAYLGFKSFGLMTTLVEGLGAGLIKLGVAEESAAGGLAMLESAAGPIAIALAAATFLFVQHSEAVRQNQQAIDDYTQALIASNGAINENVRATAFKKLQDDGAIDAANRLGISLSLVTDAMLGNKDAARFVAQAMSDAQRAQLTWSAGGATVGRDAASTTANISILTDALGTNSTQFINAQQKQKDYKAAMDVSSVAMDAQTRAMQSLAASGGVTTVALQNATTAQEQQKQSAADAAAQMFIENDAAGILKGSLDALNGKALSAADAQNAFDSSLANMGDHVTATGKKIHFTTTSIHDMSAASVALRGQLNGQVANLQRVVEANGGLSNSTGKAREQMKTMRQQIIDNAVAHGVDRKAVTDYIDKLLKIPPKVPPTKLDVDSAAALAKLATFQTAVNNLTGKTVDIYTNNYIDSLPTTAAQNAARTANQYALGNAYSGGAHNQGTGHKQAASANGNIFTAFASGGFENHAATIAPAGAMRLWAEPETGGEAYIPLAPSKRARSKAIWQETGRRLGVEGGQNVHIHIHPTPGQSEAEIGRAAAEYASFRLASA